MVKQMQTMFVASASNNAVHAADIEDLLSVFRQLDRLLEPAMAIAQVAYGAETSADVSQDSTVDPQAVERLLLRESGSPLLWVNEHGPFLPSMAMRSGSRWDRLRRTFELSAFDLDAIALTLAPEFDRRYESLYAHLQNDSMRRRPSLDLVLNLLCPDAATKVQQRSRFVSGAPLIRSGLLKLVPERYQEQSSSLGLALQLDEQAIRFLLGIPGLDAELSRYCVWSQSAVELASLFLPPEIERGVRSQLQLASPHPLSLYLQGTPNLGQRSLAEAIACEVRQPLLAINLSQILAAQPDPFPLLQRIASVTQLHNAVLYIAGWDSLHLAKAEYAQGENAHANSAPSPSKSSIYLSEQRLAAVLPGNNVVIFAGQQPWQFFCDRWRHTVTIPLTRPDFDQRRHCWQTHLNSANIEIPAPSLNALADRFRFVPSQIEQTIDRACAEAQWQAACQEKTTPQGRLPSTTDLFAAARSQSGHALGNLARKMTPKQTWDNLVLASDPLAQLRELCNQAKHRPQVYGDWGFDRKLSSSKGLTALFSGPPGTGKTMAAEIIASELQLDLYKIDLSQMVSKYIGETEKNLNRVFNAAEQANAILLFDEADAIFGKRSEVKDAHDRYANLEVAYLLQKMEEYEGISILTSNFHQNLDDAFTRRLNFIIEFQLPDEDARLSLWQGTWPVETPIAADVNLPRFAKRFELAGGNIRNIALSAAFLAAEEGQPVGSHHLLQATQREFQKMGRLIGGTEFADFKCSHNS